MNKIDFWLSDENLQKIKNWHENGKYKKEIAKEIGISSTTFSRWCKNNSKFADIFNDDTGKKAMCQNLSNNITQKRKKQKEDLHDLEKYMIYALNDLETKVKNGDLAGAVEYSLIKRALGYNYLEKRTEYTEKTGEKTVITKKHAPPDTTAQMLWLKNYKPEIWKDKKEPTEQDKLFEIKISLINPEEGKYGD